MTSLAGSLVGLLAADVPIAAPDPLGYPLPAWLIQALAYLTLTLHFAAVYFTVGGALLLLTAKLLGGERNARVAHFLGSGLPLGVSYLVTFGIPPLLFVQVLYGQLFYTSSVLIGGFWIQVIPVMITAYACFYYHKMRREAAPRRQWLIVLVAVGLLMYVGYIYSNNFGLMTDPERWASVYATSPAGGVLHNSVPGLHARYMFMVAGAFAVSGLALLWRGYYLDKWGFGELGLHSRKFGFRAFLVAAVLWLVGGVGLFMVKSVGAGDLLAGSMALKVLLAVGVLAALGTTYCVLMAVRAPSVKFTALGSLGAVVAVACIVIFRDMARMATLQPHWTLSETPVNAQWAMFLMFAGTLVAGVVLLVVLMMKVLPGIAERARRDLAAEVSAG